MGRQVIGAPVVESIWRCMYCQYEFVGYIDREPKPGEPVSVCPNCGIESPATVNETGGVSLASEPGMAILEEESRELATTLFATAAPKDKGIELVVPEAEVRLIERPQVVFELIGTRASIPDTGVCLHFEFNGSLAHITCDKSLPWCVFKSTVLRLLETVIDGTTEERDSFNVQGTIRL